MRTVGAGDGRYDEVGTTVMNSSVLTLLLLLLEMSVLLETLLLRLEPPEEKARKRRNQKATAKAARMSRSRAPNDFATPRPLDEAIQPAFHAFMRTHNHNHAIFW